MGPHVMSPDFCLPQRSEKVQAWVWEESPVQQGGSRPYGGSGEEPEGRLRAPQDLCPSWEIPSGLVGMGTGGGGPGSQGRKFKWAEGGAQVLKGANMRSRGRSVGLLGPGKEGQ